MKKLYIFKVGDTFANTKETLGDFDDWIKNFIYTNSIIETIDIINNQKLPDFDNTLGVIITGSHAMVTDNLKWSLDTEEWIRKASLKDIPILGICYGHQLIAKALGGVVQNNPNGKEIGTVYICKTKEIENDLLFNNMPDTFFANVTHRQSVLKLPKDSKVLGFNDHDKHQIVRFKNLIWGVQFHPEFNSNIMKSYIEEQKNELITFGFNIDELLEKVNETSYSNQLLQRFVKLLK